MAIHNPAPTSYHTYYHKIAATEYRSVLGLHRYTHTATASDLPTPQEQQLFLRQRRPQSTLLSTLSVTVTAAVADTSILIPHPSLPPPPPHSWPDRVRHASLPLPAVRASRPFTLQQPQAVEYVRNARLVQRACRPPRRRPGRVPSRRRGSRYIGQGRTAAGSADSVQSRWQSPRSSPSDFMCTSSAFLATLSPTRYMTFSTTPAAGALITYSIFMAVDDDERVAGLHLVSVRHDHLPPPRPASAPRHLRRPPRRRRPPERRLRQLQTAHSRLERRGWRPSGAPPDMRHLSRHILVVRVSTPSCSDKTARHLVLLAGEAVISWRPSASPLTACTRWMCRQQPSAPPAACRKR